jgi:hypothetical protein
MKSARVGELIEAFDRFDGSYKRAEMEEALSLKEEITPHLIHILEELVADPAAYAKAESHANVYAAILLAYFQEPAAHLPIIRAFSISNEHRESLWGDMVTETLPALLLQTSGGNFEHIKSLVLNKEAYDFVRSAAVDALTYAVARGLIEREQVVDFLSGLFTGTEAENDSDFWSITACSIADMHPQGTMEILRAAYAKGLVSERHMSLKELEEELVNDQEVSLARLRELVDRRIPTDVHGYLSWFACFHEGQEFPCCPCPKPAQAAPIAPARNKRKKTNRAKNKLSKKSKNKNKR